MSERTATTATAAADQARIKTLSLGGDMVDGLCKQLVEARGRRRIGHVPHRVRGATGGRVHCSRVAGGGGHGGCSIDSPLLCAPIPSITVIRGHCCCCRRRTRTSVIRIGSGSGDAVQGSGR